MGETMKFLFIVVAQQDGVSIMVQVALGPDASGGKVNHQHCF